MIAIAHLVAGFWTASNIIELVLAASAATAAGAAWWQAQKTQSLVKTTNNAAEAAREQVALGGKQLEVDRLMLEYSNKPLLSDLRNSYLRPLTANKEYFMEVPIRNIGRGPAILRNVIFGVGPGLDAIGSFNIQVLPPKEEVMATLDMKNTNPEFFAAFVEGARNQNLKVRVQYSDIFASQFLLSEFSIQRPTEENSDYIVTNVSFFDCDDAFTPLSTPFATSGPIERPAFIVPD